MDVREREEGGGGGGASRRARIYGCLFKFACLLICLCVCRGLSICPHLWARRTDGKQEQREDRQNKTWKAGTWRPETAQDRELGKPEHADQRQDKTGSWESRNAEETHNAKRDLPSCFVKMSTKSPPSHPA